jgi:hypothetical protein
MSYCVFLKWAGGTDPAVGSKLQNCIVSVYVTSNARPREAAEPATFTLSRHSGLRVSSALFLWFYYVELSYITLLLLYMKD